MATTIMNLDRYVRPRNDNDNDDDDGIDYNTSRKSKKLKLSTVNYDKFQPASIVKIKLENFVTYKLTEFNLSPSLNMIIGPNGSGKSTFVCAACLGLAGKPEYIGRSKRVDDYIKNGEDRSKIEIFLKNVESMDKLKNFNNNNNKNNNNGAQVDLKCGQLDLIKFTRIIHRDKKKSDYYINDKPVSELTVKNLVKALSIQLDNLCQFLSQERVEEFARLKSDKLLVETVRSIDPNLLDILEELKVLQNEEQTVEDELEIKQKRYTELCNERTKLEASVQSLKEFENKKLEIEYHNKLLPYVMIKDHREKLQKFKGDYEIAKRNLRDLMKDKKPFVKTKLEIEENLNEIAEDKRTNETALESSKDALSKTVENLNAIRESIVKKQSQISYYQSRTKKLQQQILSTKSELERQQSLFDSMTPPEISLFDEFDKKREELINEDLKINDQLIAIKNKGSQNNHEIGMLTKKIENKKKSFTGTDKIGVLMRNSRPTDIYNAVLYIREIPEMKGKVLEPPLISVSAKNPQFASYLDQCIDRNTSQALTLIDSDSYERFSDDILKRFRVNLRELEDIDLTPPVPRNQLQEFGFEGYLSDFLTGDKNVIKMLCQINKLHTIPVSRRELTPSQLERLLLPDQNGRIMFSKIIHGRRQLTIRQSNYTKQTSSIDSNIYSNTRNYQSSVMSDEQKDRINKEIDEFKTLIKERQSKFETLSNERSELEHQLRQIQNETAKVTQKGQELNQQRERYTMTQTTIQTLETKLDELKRDARKDVSQHIHVVEKKIAQELEQQTKLLADMVSMLKKVDIDQKELIRLDIAYFEAKNKDITMKDVVGFFDDKERELKDEYESKRRSFTELKETSEYHTWLRQIKSYDEPTRDKLNEYAEKYQNQDTFNVEYITDIIERLESEISMINHDASSITILKKVETEINELEQTLPTMTSGLATTKEKIKQNRLELEPGLDSMISKISKQFALLFNNVGSAGAVNLEKPHRFADWKVEIMVKFRDNATLKKLDSHTQSGGERAVSTVLYMIALQEFTAAPFRVVDEINQGMDSRNERIVHKAMVENACAENTSQYFLITPKLLTDLHYHEKMRIHCVMAGSWIPNPSDDPEMVHFGETSNYIL
ncbi:DNA repair ATPase SMC5 NDAI_0A08450 [Naumovozyma dairenensis CBS 421]|uniref:Structural maintenance of chromosomes protein 5 n=1 Tax=Naumovozyma dairenensis (strain ATCC 10597 / BCRC 20456 / CBS 421 / NBRC 0211 / NRRL Y-12639) TaxID=1071378 RepID=G0W5B0_NAUDC|nr:hypothetical protein NDAI_0A08450 [Naumovozyma dairenensis CBS 421]CCD22998.1 hypothetical protein NDAI_0A08450 [Naumovozyma dairenensis CBS 421]